MSWNSDLTPNILSIPHTAPTTRHGMGPMFFLRNCLTFSLRSNPRCLTGLHMRLPLPLNDCPAPQFPHPSPWSSSQATMQSLPTWDSGTPSPAGFFHLPEYLSVCTLCPGKESETARRLWSPPWAVSPQGQKLLACAVQLRAFQRTASVVLTVRSHNRASHGLLPVASGQLPFPKIVSYFTSFRPPRLYIDFCFYRTHIFFLRGHTSSLADWHTPVTDAGYVRVRERGTVPQFGGG